MNSRSELKQSDARIEWREGWRGLLAILCAATTMVALIWQTAIHESDSLTLIAGITIGLLLLSAPGTLALRWDAPGQVLLFIAFGFSLLLFVTGILSIGPLLAIPSVFALLGFLAWPRDEERPNSKFGVLTTKVGNFLFLPLIVGLASLLAWIVFM